MRLFRSEEHVVKHSAKTGIPAGATFSLDSLWRLSRSWFHDRLSPGWRRRSVQEAHDIFERAGLTGPFWRLDT